MKFIPQLDPVAFAKKIKFEIDEATSKINLDDIRDLVQVIYDDFGMPDREDDIADFSAEQIQLLQANRVCRQIIMQINQLYAEGRYDALPPYENILAYILARSPGMAALNLALILLTKNTPYSSSVLKAMTSDFNRVTEPNLVFFANSVLALGDRSLSFIGQPIDLPFPEYNMSEDEIATKAIAGFLKAPKAFCEIMIPEMLSATPEEYHEELVKAAQFITEEPKPVKEERKFDGTRPFMSPFGIIEPAEA